ncbi:hypothetical protein SCHPADRAFT_993492 [Schizopora paradoxa]|uniref:Uncharacterized protein n=1 Tax=Schizopora paradoxa TaxID=27342 RepID=A0A0H2SNG9_9AGAM|nr:hypothetical protein SCHPADRAFT_993492 [Schizopora paradoxa]
MKFIFAVLALAASAFAQSVSIASPTPGQNVNAGQGATVIIQKGDSITPSTEIGVAITLHHCTQSPCEDASQTLGSVLYSGPFTPQRPTGSPGLASGAPFEGFGVTIPQGFATGEAVVTVVHSSLIGAGPFFSTESKTVSVNVV